MDDPSPPPRPLPAVRLGRTSITVTRLGFGAAPLGDLYARLDEAEAVATAVAALRAGVGLIDTSPLYGHGLAEHRIGAALRLAPQAKPVLSTKVGRVMDPFLPCGERSGYVGGLPHAARFDYSGDGVLRSLEQSLLRLGTNRIDIALIHDVDAWTHGTETVEARFAEAMAGAYPALVRLRDQGLVGAIGVGVNDAAICARFLREGDFDTLLIAGRYSLLEQPALADLLPLALEKQVGVLLGGVFNSGILATGPRAGARYNYRPAPPDILDRVARIERVCAAHDVSLFTAALRFGLGHPAVASVVLGAVKPAEIAAQVAAMTTPVPAALWDDLKAERLLDASAPAPE